MVAVVHNLLITNVYLAIFGIINVHYSEDGNPEEVRHGDVTAGVKRAWIVITADKYSFFHS